MSSEHRLGASNLLALRRRVAPLTRLETRSTGNPVEPVGVGAAVRDLRTEISRVLDVFHRSKGNWCQWLAVDDCEDKEYQFVS